jgi:WD40 repeat protein
MDESEGCESIRFSPDSRQLLLAYTLYRGIAIWNLVTCTIQRQFRTLISGPPWVSVVAISPNCTQLVSTWTDGTMSISDIESGHFLHQTLQVGPAKAKSMAFSPDSKSLAVFFETSEVWAPFAGDKVQIWDPNAGKCRRTFRPDPGILLSKVVFLPDSQNLAIITTSGNVIRLDTATGTTSEILIGSHTVAIAFSQDNERLAKAELWPDQISLWDMGLLNRSKQTLSSDAHSDWIIVMKFSPDGVRLASGSSDKVVRIWAVATGACEQILKGHEDHIETVVFSPNGAQLSSASSDMTVRIWDVSEGICAHTLRGHEDIVETVAFSPDGKRLASGSQDKSVRIWTVETGSCDFILNGHCDLVPTVAFSPDGVYLASGSGDRTVRIWNVADGGCKHILESHQDRIKKVVFSPDGTRLASRSYDKTARIWDIETGKYIARYRETSGRYRQCLDTEPWMIDLHSKDPTFRAIWKTMRTSTSEEYNEDDEAAEADDWITHNEERLLWLPPQYRRANSAVYGNVLALGTLSYRVVFFHFSSDSKLYSK